MRPQPTPTPTIKDWDLFFQGEKDDLYACFHLFYDDFYRLGLSWYKDVDIIQESIHNLFIELWKIWRKPKNIKNKKQYVLTVYRNICYKTYKDYHVPSSVDNIEVVESFDINYELPYEDLLIASQTDLETQRRLQEALSKLTNRQKEIIKWRYFEELSFQEIAIKTQLTERTIYNTLHSGIKQLREYLKWVILVILFY